MQNDLFIKILARGRDVGLGRKFNISDILQSEFPKPTTPDKNNWRSEIAIQIDVLKDMQDKLNIIKFDGVETNKVYWYENKDRANWFDNTTFDVWVTVTGLDYLNQYYLRQSYFGLNGTLKESTEKQTTTNQTIANNSTNQTWLLLLTALITISNLAVTIYNINSSDTRDKVSQQLQEQSKQIHTLQIELSKSINLHFQDLSVKKISPKKN